MTAQIAPGLRDRLTAWLDRAIETGRFDVPSGRHIVLNESRKFVRLARLQASAGTGEETLIAFFTSLNPDVTEISARCCRELERQLASEKGSAIALKVCQSDETAKAFAGRWHVYIPALSELRRARAARIAAVHALAARPPVHPLSPTVIPLPVSSVPGAAFAERRV